MSLRAIYFVGFEELDWSCRVEVPEDGGRPTLSARFRYYEPTPRSDDVWDGVDEKSPEVDLRFIPSTPLKILFESAEMMQETVARNHPAGPPRIVDRIIQEDGDFDAFMAKAQLKEWLHVKTFDSIEAAERFMKSKEPS